MNGTDPSGSSPPRDSKGWDGKLRITRDGESAYDPEAPSPPESEDERHVEEVPGENIDADEDLLDGVNENEPDIDLNHNRITSIHALKLERFKKVERLCLRQNQITSISFPDSASWQSSNTLVDIDLYDNLISHIKGLDGLSELTSLDLSFNKIKHIKNVDHLKKLKDLYFVQNKISKIEGLEGLKDLRNLELAANRIREIENLDTLGNLEELWLGKNKISELKNLSSLHNLRLLSIQSNRLTSPSLSHISTLPNLRELYISYNLLDSLEPLSGCTKIEMLEISSNPITSLSGLNSMTDLAELWASDCKLESFEEIERELADKKHLETVYFERNPLYWRQQATYRNKVRLALPTIKQIDATFVRLD